MAAPPKTEKLLLPEQAAELLQVSPRTLKRYRSNGQGPPWRRIGKRLVRYASSDIRAYMAKTAASGAVA